MEYIGSEDKPTAKQIHDLEASHKILFAILALSNNTYVNLFKRYMPQWKKDPNYQNTFEFKTLQKLGVEILQKAKNWFDLQNYLEEKAHIPSTKIKQSDFLIPKKNLSILQQAKQYISDWQMSGTLTGGEGIGIIPLIIWGVIVLAGAISAAFIVDRLTVSTKDREELLKATAQTCSDLKLTPQECAGVVTSTQQEETKNAKAVSDTASAVGGGITKILFLGAALFLGYKLINKKSN